MKPRHYSCFAEINDQELEFKDASARADEKFVGGVVYIYLLLNLFPHNLT